MKDFISKKRILILFLFILSLYKITYSQEKFNGFAINPKFGMYFSSNSSLPGTSFGGEFDLLKNKLILGLDYYHSKFKFIGNKEEYFNQFDLLLGRYFDIYLDKDLNMIFLRFQLQAGIGSYKGITYNDSKSISTLGIPIKIGLKHLFSESISFGFDLQANLNSQYPIYMIMLSLELGKLKN